MVEYRYEVILYAWCYTTGAAKRPTWRVTLDPIEAGGPYVISAESRGCNITLSDVLFGDVWLCSGQSNMDFHLLWVSSANCKRPF